MDDKKSNNNQTSQGQGDKTINSNQPSSTSDTRPSSGPTQASPTSSPQKAAQQPPANAQQSQNASGDSQTINNQAPKIQPQETANAGPSMVASSQDSKSFGGKKIIATIFGVLLLIGAVAAGVFLVQREQEIREKAATGSECKQSPDCTLFDEPGNSGSETVDRTISHLFITAKEFHRFDPPGINDGCYDVSIDGNSFSWNRIGDGPDCKDVSNIQVWMLSQIPTNTPVPPEVPGCPANTVLLFTKQGNIDVGDTTDAGGTVTSMEDDWRVGTEDGVPVAEDGEKITVDFSGPVVLDTVLIHDNDPKSGEQPWSINGVSLPTTGNNDWTTFKMDSTTSQMNFDNGGDSPHFNICVSQTTPTATPTSTPTPSPTPTLPPQITAQCYDVKVYDLSWNLMSQADLSELREGDTIRFAVSGTASEGTFDMARFSVNGTSVGSTSNQKPGSDEFYIEYTIPDGIDSFTVDGEIHHAEIGWF